MSLLDTPLRISLTDQSTALRTELKEYERDFFARHSRRPDRTDIKQNEEIAGRYKQYNKVRDVLNGKLSRSALDEGSSPSRKSKRTSSANATTTPRRTRSAATPRKALGHRLTANDLDPYDTPSSVSPRPQITSLGPTPQRDGRVMGIFDMLEQNGTPLQGSRKRKLSEIIDDELAQEDEEMAPNSQERTVIPAQTPARTRTRGATGDVLDHLGSASQTGRRNKHSRTPASEGRKFALSQFFATPSAVRYASMLKDPDADELLGGPALITATPKSKTAATPLLDRVLGRTPVKPIEPDEPDQGDKTPAYLKRTHSFKQRLLSAATTKSIPEETSADGSEPTSPKFKRPIPRHLVKSKYNPRPLSKIAQQLKEREAKQALKEAQAAEAAAGDDDELDALREIEENGDVLVDDSQAKDTEGDADDQPQRKWKKRGQKRTTRRAIMRPSKVRVYDPNYRQQTPKGGIDAEASDNEENVEEIPQQVVEETQLPDSTATVYDDDDFEDDELLAEIFANSDDELFGVRPASKSPAPARARKWSRDVDEALEIEGREDQLVDGGAEADTGQDGNDDYDYEDELLATAEDDFRSKPTPSNYTNAGSSKKDSTATVTAKKPKSAKKASTANKGKRKDEEDEYELLPPRKINPNAQSHMNFRSLKIKNKGSRARGGGRFGGRGKRR